MADIAASFQAAVVEIVAVRAGQALERFRAELPGAAPCLVVAGGVAANRAIAAALQDIAVRHGARLVVPPIALCTDNGAMVAWAGAERMALGVEDDLFVAARPRWPLDTPGMKVDSHGA